MRLAFVDDVDQERGVAAVRHPPFNLDLAVEEVRDGIVDRVNAEFDTAVF